ncbi:MAG: hypothetical protein ABFS86_01690 [Planctomycetota bacterium]
MSERVIDNPVVKRNLLYSTKASDGDLNAAAGRFIERERYGEALEFLERTRDAALLGKIREEAARHGDTFLLLRVEKLSGEAIPADEWRAVAGTAESHGKYYDAYRALGKAGDEEAAEAIREEHMPEYEPFRPEGK